MGLTRAQRVNSAKTGPRKPDENVDSPGRQSSGTLKRISVPSTIELQTEAGRQGDDRNISLPGFYTAIQEQLGLKLKEAKRPAPVLVIDHIDMPTEN
jgi:uncharacterized protein (TIGR03435 family)